MYPLRSSSTHTEQLGNEASVYDWAHAQVHALNPTAARVWWLCDGATSTDAIAAALRVEMGIPEADAIVDLTLKELARLHLLELPVQSLKERPAPTRRWLLGRGLAAAMLPAVYTILTPSPLEAQSPGGAPTLTSVTPNQGLQGATVAVTLTGSNFIVGGTTVNVSGSGVTVNSVIVAGTTALSANFVIAPGAAEGARTVTVTTAAGTSRRANLHGRAAAAAGHSNARQHLAESRTPGHYRRGYADGHRFHRRRHDGGSRRRRRDGHQRRRERRDLADGQLRARSGRG
jgi:hypothetical protein